MKKLCLVAILALFGLNVSAQNNDDGGFYGGINAGLPVGDFSEYYSFAFAVDVGYTCDIDDDINIGVESGYTNFLGKDNFGGFSFLPIAGIAEFSVSDEVDLEGGAGYAISLESGGGGDFYWKIGGTYDLSDDDEVVLSYRSLSSNGSSLSGVFLGYRRNF